MRFNYADDRLPVSMSYGGAMYYLMYDQVGTLRAVANSSGNIIKQVDYDSFGNIINDSNPSLGIPFGFAGGLHDRDTGLVRFGYRDYDAGVGRWTAKDPIDFDSGFNLYGYVLSDPVGLVDLLGFDYISNGIIYDDNGYITGELPLEDPNPFLDPINYCGCFFGGWYKTGYEIKISKNCRIAPFGNRTNDTLGKWPHYHRRVPDPNKPGQSLPGQGIGRHRPCEKKSTDKSFFDRF